MYQRSPILENTGHPIEIDLMLGQRRRRVCLVDILLKSVTTPNESHAADQESTEKECFM